MKQPEQPQARGEPFAAPPPEPPAFLQGGGEMGRLIRSHDWRLSPLGDPGVWPATLRAAVSMVLASRQPMYIAWGPSLVSLYNDAYVPFCGTKHPASVGQPYVKMWAEIWDSFRPLVEATMAGEAQLFEDAAVALAGRDSPMSWFNFSYTPLRDEGGEVRGFLSVAIETTDKVLALRRLAEEREDFARLFEQAPTFMAMLRGPTHRVELANPGYLQLIGHRPVLGMTIAEALPDAAAQGYVELLDQVYASGKAFSATGSKYDVQVEAGGPVVERFVDFVFQPIRDVNDQVTGIFVEGVDVTSRTDSEAALRKTEAQLRALNADLERQVVERARERSRTWQVSPDLLGVLSDAGYFEKSNPSWQTVLGWSENEVGRTSVFNLVHPDDEAVMRDGLAQLRLGQPVLNWVVRFRRKDGALRWISWVAVPEEEKYYCSGRDISREKEAQHDLDLAQEALRQAQKMEAVGQLTGGIAHDFNNLLGSISASLQVLEARIGKGLHQGAERYVAMGQESVRRAAALTQRLLAFSRRQTLDPKPTDVNRLVGGMEDLIRRTVGPSVELEVVGAGGLWATKVDPAQLESSLLNLCINARDAMLPNGGRLTIETANKWLDERSASARELAPGQYISLCVSDTGTGMSAEVIARAFDPFFTTKPMGQGTGLGLSMVYGFVRQSGGQVRIYSEEGQGTTMCLYLPRHVGDVGTDEMRPAALAMPQGDGETVLVIDDEATIRLLIAEVLEDAGYRVLQAEDGPGGLRILQSDARIDLLVTDVGLPGGMNGRQVADAGRVGRQALKVLFITGYAENAAVGNGLLDRGMEVITKPFDINALAAKVREMIER